jgi:hypothetical protein
MDIVLRETLYPDIAFDQLIQKAGKTTPVVILIDEYDTPILDNLNEPTLAAIKQILRSFYKIIKANEEFIRFTFITVKPMATSGEHQALSEKTMSVYRQLTVKQEVAVTQHVYLTKNPIYRCHFCGCLCSEKLRWAKFCRQNRHYADMAQFVMDSFPKPTD